MYELVLDGQEGAEILNQVAEQVQGKEDVTLLATIMLTQVNSLNGAGLAAPQVGVSKRVIVVEIDGKYQVMINPVITRHTQDTKISREGCLSFPKLGTKVPVKRFFKVTVEYFDINWKPQRYNLKGFEAYCVQHELDHLNGITIKQGK